MRKRDALYIIFAVVLVFGLIFSHFGGRIFNKTEDRAESGILAVHFQDVGNADSVFIQLPDGKIALIDGAERENAKDIIDYIESLGTTKIDYLIATHPHSDHIGGLAEIIDALDVSMVFMPDAVHTTSEFEDMINSIEKKNIPVTKAEDKLVLFEGEGYKAECLSPSGEYDNLNDYSIVLKLTYKNKSFLFMGDAEKTVEKELVENYGYALRSDVLKVGHHGSDTSSCKEFLEAVNPKIGVISVGKGNDYGHPHKEVIKRLERYGIEILRTDKTGTVVLKTDGFDWRE